MTRCILSRRESLLKYNQVIAPASSASGWTVYCMCDSLTNIQNRRVPGSLAPGDIFVIRGKELRPAERRRSLEYYGHNRR